MNLFIDANIFLDFYHLSSDDIEELKKLVELIGEGKVKLHVTEQIISEMKRNRDAKVTDAMKNLRSASFKVSVPVFCRSYEHYTILQDHLKKANEAHSKLCEKAAEDINSRDLAADSLITDLVEKANVIKTTDRIFSSALWRFRLGNPPGKKKVTMGDEVNWECLLHAVGDEEDLYLISGDKDYCSPVNADDLDSFLHNEWRDAKKSEIHFFKSLSGFFKEKFPEVKLASDIKINALIEKLTMSGTFATTHAVISKLSEYTELSKSQIESAVQAAELNNQVYWIIEDSDLQGFYKGVLEKNDKIIDEDLKNRIKKLIIIEDNGNDDDEDDDAVPF